MTDLSWLGHQLATAAGCAWGFDLGSRFRSSVMDSSHGNEAMTWSPGIGIAATQPIATCQWCGRQYIAISVEHNQGDNCAAAASRFDDGHGRKEWRLIGHYGSIYDMTVFRWNDYPDWVGDRMLDPVCDNCIAKLIDDGTLERIGEVVLPYDLDAPITVRYDDRKETAS